MTTNNKLTPPPTQEKTSKQLKNAETLREYQRIVTAVARRFSVALCRDLGTYTVDMIDQRNAKETKPGICHSHDFCDTNIYMQQAILEETGEDPADGNGKAESLWNHAWNAAKRYGFRRLGLIKGNPEMPSKEPDIHNQGTQLKLQAPGFEEPVSVAMDYWGRDPHLQALCYEVGREDPVVCVRYDKAGKIVEVLIQGPEADVVFNVSTGSARCNPATKACDSPWETERDANPPCIAGDQLLMPSGQIATVLPLQEVYVDAEEFQRYEDSFGLLCRMDGHPGSKLRNGVFVSVQQAWEVNPLIVSTKDPSDYSTVPTDKP